MKLEELKQQIRKMEADFANVKTSLNKWDDILSDRTAGNAGLERNKAV